MLAIKLKNQWNKSLLVTFLSSLSLLSMSASAQSPNIVLILADDLGYADVGFNGSKDITTPNLDALAGNGVSFNEAYVAHPFCGPSRAALMTGRYPHKIGAQFNLPTKGSYVGVPITEPYISEVLQQAGYTTGAIGKWHLGEAPQFHPNRRGFDEFYGFTGGGHHYFPEVFSAKYQQLKKQAITNIDHYLLPLERNGVEVVETEYVTDGLSREAVNFVNSAKQTHKPFFLYLAYNAPHVPLHATEEDLAQFSHIKNNKRRNYAAMVYAVDRGVGKLVQALKDNQQLDNTLIVFLSDNGGNTNEGANNSPLKQGKGSVFEGGFRVPMLMHWPEKLAKGQQFEHPVLAIDFFPTFAGLAGVDLSQNDKLDGKDVWSAIQQNINPHKDDLIYALRHRKGYSDAAVRRNEWKAVKFAEKDWQLFNIEKDPQEQHDVSRKHPAMLADMVREMEKWSWDNAQPLWFHESFEGAQWRLDGMPRFDKTFKLNP